MKQKENRKRKEKPKWEIKRVKKSIQKYLKLSFFESFQKTIKFKLKKLCNFFAFGFKWKASLKLFLGSPFLLQTFIAMVAMAKQIRIISSNFFCRYVEKLWTKLEEQFSPITDFVMHKFDCGGISSSSTKNALTVKVVLIFLGDWAFSFLLQNDNREKNELTRSDYQSSFILC